MIKTRPSRSWALGIAGLLLAALLNACGPGTGGTGVGPPPVTSSTITNGTSIVYSSTISDLNPPAPPVTAAPSACSNSSIALNLQALRVSASTNCLRFSFTGAWQINADGTATIQGELQISTSPGGVLSSQLGTLELRYPSVDINSPSLTLTIRDSGGVTVIGPITMQKAPT